jgi:ubiquinone/menaquinone biosynthesis C-methylase UbiE
MLSIARKKVKNVEFKNVDITKKFPFEDEVFDQVISIGCLHHTEDIQGCVNEIYRVLKMGGNVLIMLYNKNSFRRRVVNPVRYLTGKIQGSWKYTGYAEFERSTYDQDSCGKTVPFTSYFSRAEVRRMFGSFEKVNITVENFDNMNLLSLTLPRNYFLKNVARIWGLDLYIRAHK